MDITSENLGIPETEYSATVGPPCPRASRAHKGRAGLWAWGGCRPPGDRVLGRGAVGRRPAARLPSHACMIALPLARPAHSRPAPPHPTHPPPPPRCACPPPSSSASPRTCPASGTRVGGPVQHRGHGWVGRRGELRPVGFALEARDTQAPVSARVSPPPVPSSCSANCRSRGQRDQGRRLLVSGLKSSFLLPLLPSPCSRDQRDQGRHQVLDLGGHRLRLRHLPPGGQPRRVLWRCQAPVAAALPSARHAPAPRRPADLPLARPPSRALHVLHPPAHLPTH